MHNEKFFETVTPIGRTRDEADCLIHELRKYVCDPPENSHDRIFSLWYDEENFFLGSDMTDVVIEENGYHQLTKIGDSFSVLQDRQVYSYHCILEEVFRLLKDWEEDEILTNGGVPLYEQESYRPFGTFYEIIRKNGQLDQENLAKLGEDADHANFFDGDDSVESLTYTQMGELALDIINSCPDFIWFPIPSDPETELLYEKV